MNTVTQNNNHARYLADRLMDEYYSKENELDRKYRKYIPKTLKETVELLRNGKWELKNEAKLLKQEEDDIEEGYHPSGHINEFFYDVIWDGKDVDPKAREEAFKKMREDYNSHKDRIMVLDAEQGLKALNEFKARTYH